MLSTCRRLYEGSPDKKLGARAPYPAYVTEYVAGFELMIPEYLHQAEWTAASTAASGQTQIQQIPSRGLDHLACHVRTQPQFSDLKGWKRQPQATTGHDPQRLHATAFKSAQPSNVGGVPTRRSRAVGAHRPIAGISGEVLCMRMKRGAVASALNI
jgi:hypothetical protein